ncbi:hypothetical protein Syun_014988 [Stephania yunnanensis]|uniref:AAA+ ATPase domain-containing protein n=1 Tax=Stephania yunnanensis TaxID=152371 RepID=A0AAP0JKC5_9MAGN
MDSVEPRTNRCLGLTLKLCYYCLEECHANTVLAMAASAPSKCFLVTGPPGIGKTTLVMRVLDTLSTSNPNLKIHGFYSRKSISNAVNREVREGNERVGFEVVTVDGKKGSLASSTVSSPESLRWPSVGKYRVDVASFESLVMPELQVKDDTDLFVIDEVGKMELFSSSFFPAVLNVLNSNIPLLATVPIPKFGRDIPGVARLKNHPGAALFTLNKTNRDSVKEQIYSQISELLHKP